jgi:hypothetical protein
MSPLASHIILLGENAGANLGALTDIIGLGREVLSGGLAAVAQNGTIVIGGLSLDALNNIIPPEVFDGPITSVGAGNIPLQTSRVGALVMLGAGIGANFPALGLEPSASVFIGNNVLGRQRALRAGYGLGNALLQSVIIGDGAARGHVGLIANGDGTSIGRSVIIGAEAMGNIGLTGGGAASASNIAIGYQAGLNFGFQSAGSNSNTIAIGSTCASNAISTSNNVFVGSGINISPTSGSEHTMIGHGIVGTWVAGSSGNVALGATNVLSGLGSGNILIGTACNSTVLLPAAANHRFLVETGIAVKRTLLYGLMSDASPGGLIVGDSTTANRDVPGFNILKIIDGSSTGVAPVGGGFLTSIAGELHWRSTGNIDYAITPGASRGIFTVATLPVPGVGAPQGNTAFVTDALAPAFGAAPTAGGAVFVPVYCDGAAWFVG